MTARRRASQVGDAMRRGMTPPAPKTAPATNPLMPPSKYTALLDPETAAHFDDLALAARRQLGRRVDKSELLRALILLAADDASLRDQVISEVARRSDGTTA